VRDAGRRPEKLRLVADSWPPFTDANMPGGGLATSIVTTALNPCRLRQRFEEVPWAGRSWALARGATTCWSTPGTTMSARASARSPAPTSSTASACSSARAKAFKRQADLYPYTIAVVRDYAYSPGFDSDERLNKVPVRSFSSAVRMLAAGRVNLTVEDEYVARYNLQREPQQVRDGVSFVDPPLSENSLHILVSLKHPEHRQVVARFEKAIAAMKADGSYARLLRQHGF
jgi:polar amino acid transport system substrate-binding protein